MTTDVTLDHVLALARRLHPVDQARLIARLATTIEQLLGSPPPANRPQFGSARGLITMADDFDAPLEDFREYMP